MQQSNYMYGDLSREDWYEEAVATTESVGVIPTRIPEKQGKMDSFMESVCNIAVGFIISLLVWVWIVAPLFNLKNDASTSFLITCIFTVTSLARQYILRRLFNGRTIWETLRAKAA